MRAYLAAVCAGMLVTMGFAGIFQWQSAPTGQVFNDLTISNVLGGAMAAGLIGFVVYSPLDLSCRLSSAAGRQMSLPTSCLVGALSPTLILAIFGWVFARPEPDYPQEVMKFLVAIAAGGLVAGAVFWRIGLRPAPNLDQPS
jgi:multisubunit Na+/H+ antiporter MnhB subunit